MILQRTFPGAGVVIILKLFNIYNTTITESDMNMPTGSSILLSLIVLLLFASCTTAEIDADIAIVNVNIIPMDREHVLESHTILIREDLIRFIGPSDRVNVPDDASIIDGSGRYLIPGLAEMHAHVPGPPAEFADEESREQFNEWVENVLFLYVAAGVTNARSMIGHPAHLPLRERVERGDIVGPRLWTSGPGLHGGNLQTVERARQIPFEQRDAGYDFMKILWGIERDVYEALYEAAQEADFWPAGHVPAAVGVPRALETGYLTIDHLDGYIELLVDEDVEGLPEPGFFGFGLVEYIDEDRIPAAARMTRDAGVWVVPTQMLFDGVWGLESLDELIARPELHYIPGDMLENWISSTREFRDNPLFTQERLERYRDIRLQLIMTLHDEGAGILLGSDAPQWWNVPGFSIHRELETYIEAGLTPYEALRTGTVNIAEFFEIEDLAGTLQVGKRADAVLLDGNPLDDIANVGNVEGVLIRGNWLSGDEIQKTLERIADRYGN
jgi:imidazolonepropionase-like amidohydrolase